MFTFFIHFLTKSYFFAVYERVYNNKKNEQTFFSILIDICLKRTTERNEESKDEKHYITLQILKY